MTTLLHRLLHAPGFPLIAIMTLSTYTSVAWVVVSIRPQAAIGVFGVLSHSVGQRRREIGIRKALGTSSASIHRMVLREGMQLVAIGIVIGLAAAAAINTILAKLLAGVLFDSGVLDPWTFVVVPLIIAASGGPACWIPAAKATRVDPMEAMRHD